MAKDVRFNIKLNVDGKDVVVQASTNVKELADNLGLVHDNVTAADKAFMRWSQSVMAIQSIQQSVNQLNSALQGITAESMSFGKSMKAANTMAGKDAAGFSKLKEQVTELSKSIPIARDELANGLYMVISNGVPEDNWISYLESSAKASVGGLADLQKVVTVTSTLIKNYGLSWDAAAEIQDKIQLTAKNGVTSFEQLADALPSVAGSAAQLGISIDELMAVFATCTGVTGNTAEVSTQLGAVLKSLISPSAEAAKAAEAMGIKFDAAAIKEAGGLENFLTILDKSIKDYSARTGELSETIYANLFGSARALRLLTPITNSVSDKFSENVDTMKDSAGTIDTAFTEMSSTAGAAIQKIKNKFGELTDFVAPVAGYAMPMLNFAATLGTIALSAESMRRSLVMLTGGMVRFTQATALGRAAALLWNATAVRMNAIVKLLSASFKGAAVSARTLKLAIEGLLIVGGVTAAWVALTEILSLFTSESGKATIASEALSEAEDAFKNKLAETKMAVDDDIKKLEQLISTKADTTEEVKNLNERYGELLGTYQTGAEWLTTLKDKSDEYCQQLAIEAKTDTIRRKIFEKNAELMMIAEKKRRLEEAGKATRKMTVSNNGVEEAEITVMTPEYREVVEDERKLQSAVNELQGEFDIASAAAEKHRRQLKETQQTTQQTAQTVDVLKRSYTELGEAIEEQKKKVGRLAGVEGKESEAKAEAKKLREMEARYKALGKKYGLDKSGGANKRHIIADPKTLEELRTNIELTKKKLTDADTAEQKQLREQIRLWQKKVDAIELAQKKATLPVGAVDQSNKVDTTKIQTESEAKDVLEYLNAVKKVTTEKEKIADLDRQIVAVELRQAELLRPTAGMLQSLYGNKTIKVNVEQGSVNLPQIPADDKVIKVNVEQGNVNLPEIPADDKVIKVNVEQGSVNLPQIPADDKVIKVNVEQGNVNLPEIPADDKVIKVNVEQGDTETRPLEILQAIDNELNYQRALRKTATAENLTQIDEIISRLETLKSYTENVGVINMDNSALQNYDQLNIKLSFYRDQLKKALPSARPIILQHIKDLEEIEARWQAADKAATINPNIGNISTLKEINDAISFYSERQQKEDAAQIQKTQAIIDQLTAKKTAIEIGVKLPSLQREVAEIMALTGREYTLKIKGMGFDSLIDKVRELNKLLSNPNLGKEQRAQLMRLRDSYADFAKEAAQSFSTYRKGWEGIKGIGNGIQGITDALEGNGSAWEKATAVVDGFLQIYDGISSVVEMVNTLTAATNLQTAAKTQETTATAMNTAAVATETTAIASDTAAAATNTAVKSGQAIAGATASGASMPFPYNLIAIAAGIAAVIAALSMISGFATGGVVGGNSPTGDRVLARVNSGEMILNKRQQQRLLYILNGGALSAGLTPAMPKPQRVDLNVNALQSQLKPYEVRVSGSLKGRGRDLVATIELEKNHNKRS